MKSCCLYLSKGVNIRVEVEHEQISFYLKDENLVTQIQQVKDAGRLIDIPAKLLTHIRYYACFNDALENHLQSSLIFCSYYNIPVAKRDEVKQGFEPKIALRSFVSLDGDVIHRILEELLNQDNCEEVVSVHYWLVAQILNRLQFDFNLLTWQLALFSPACTIAGALIIPKVFWSAGVTAIALFVILFLVALLWIVTTTVHNRLENQLRKTNNQQTFIKAFDTLYKRRQITSEQVRTILQTHHQGSSLRDISRITGLAYETVVDVIDTARWKAQMLYNRRFCNPRADWLAQVDLYLSIALVILILHLLKNVVQIDMLAAAGLGAVLWLFMAMIYHWLAQHWQMQPEQLAKPIISIVILITFVSVQNLSLFALMNVLLNGLLVVLFPLLKPLLKQFVLPLMSRFLIRCLLSPNYILRSVFKQIFA